MHSTQNINPQYAAFMAQRQFGSLDGLRALSILGVIWHHTAPSWLTGAWVHAGSQGVTLFFAISGFLITTLLAREWQRCGAVDFKAFYMRRALRIFPLYYGVLALYVALVWLVPHPGEAEAQFFDNLIYFATYTSNIFVELEGRTIFYYAWSLATEEQFYLIWPTVMLLAGSVSRAVWPLVAVLVAAVLGQSWGYAGWSVVSVSLLGGALLALLLNSPRWFAWLARALGGRGAAALILVALLAVLTWVPDAPPLVLSVLCAALVGACVLQEQHALTGLLTWRPLAYLGTISYGLYMLHMLCKNMVVLLLGRLGQPQDGLLVVALTLSLAVLAATLSFRYYEAYFLRRKNAFVR